MTSPAGCNVVQLSLLTLDSSGMSPGFAMDLDRINRDNENGAVRWGAGAAVLVALLTLVGGVGAWLAGAHLYGGIAMVLGAAEAGLALGVLRGSRSCAIAVLALWATDRALLTWLQGPLALLNVWTIVVTLLLIAGTRGVFAKRRRATAQPRLPAHFAAPRRRGVRG